MSDTETVSAFGLVGPDGTLSTFAGYSDEAAWAVLAYLLGRDANETRDALKSKGWSVVPVEISRSKGSERKGAMG